MAKDILNVVDMNRMEKLENMIRNYHDGLYRAKSGEKLTMGAIATIVIDKLYALEGYDNALTFMEQRLDLKISKAQLSDIVNTFKAFGDVKTGLVKDIYSDYTFSQLKLMRKLTKENLVGVDPTWTCEMLRDLLKSQKSISKKNDDTTDNADADTTDNADADANDDYTLNVYKKTSYNVDFIRRMTNKQAKECLLSLIEGIDFGVVEIAVSM